MQSSSAVTFRALVMLACVIGIPIWAVSGSSWSEVAKKFQNFQWPAIFTTGSSPSKSAVASEAPRFTPSAPASGPSAEAVTIGNAAAEKLPPAAPSATSPAMADVPTELPGLAVPPADLRVIQVRLRELGATYYRLEMWGDGQELYRFYCKVAVGGNADYTHCFEASDADPLQAMRQVLQRVESWRGGLSMASRTNGILKPDVAPAASLN